MNLRKVLLLTYHFPPSAAVAVYRTLGLVRHLPSFGWQPIVVAPPSTPFEPEDPALLERIPHGTPVTRVPLAAGLWGKLVRRVAPQVHWLPRALRACRHALREHRIEAVITSGPPGAVHLLGMRLRARHGLPWVACFRDPWIVNHPSPPRGLRGRFERFLEGRVMRSADVLVANTPLNQEGWQAAYPRFAHKMTTVTNGFDPDLFAEPAEPPPGGGLDLLHAGELYSGRDPRPLLDALVGLPGVHVTFLGRSTELIYDLPAEVRARGLEGAVTLVDQVPYAESLRRVRRAGALLLILAPGLRVGVPAKLYEYLGANRPILALAEPDGDIAWVLRESGVLHRVVPARDVQGIRQALVELAGAVAAGTPVVSEPSGLRNFTREHMARRFAECLDACARHTP
jgi:glycosyltransferase involved in cell wall biosynthesis